MAGPDIIPKVIHQIQLGGSLSKSKSYFYQKTHKIYPNYKMKLWGDSNITRKNFPFTYDVLKNMLSLQNKHDNMLAIITKIMRNEILFHEGGFWKDTGLNILQPAFDSFLKYSVVVEAKLLGSHGWSQGTSFYANRPRVKYLQRMVSQPSINRIRIHSENPLASAGTLDFWQVMNTYS